MTNLPKTVQWVLDLDNIYKTPGKFNSNIYPSKFKRIPIPQKKDLPNLVIKNDRIINRSTGDHWSIIEEASNINSFELEREIEALKAKKRELLGKYPEMREILQESGALIKKKYTEEKRQNELDAVRKLVSSKDIEKKIQYLGNTAVLGLENYKEFFLKNGIPPFTGKELLLENHEPLSTLDTESFAKRPKRNDEPGFYEYYENNPPIEFLFSKEVGNVCGELSRVLRDLVMGAGTYKSLVLSIAHIRNLYRNYIFKDKPIIPGVLYACIANSGIDDQDICSRLRQCPYCGRFWIAKKSRGRPREFCCEKCSTRSDDQTREVNGIASKKSKEQKKKADKKKILEVMKRKYGSNAEKVYKQEIEGKISTYKDFVRRKGKYYNLKS